MSISISTSIDNFLDIIELSRSSNTARSYRNGLNLFQQALEDHDIDLGNPASSIKEETIGWFAEALKEYSPATEQMYLVSATRYFQFLVAEEMANINLQRVQMILQTRARKSGIRLPQFPVEDIKKVIAYGEDISNQAFTGDNEELIAIRDGAFLITLADTGLRVHEICNLRRGDFDWSEHKAIIIGKGDKEAIIRFSERSIKALRNYLDARGKLDGQSGRSLASLPLFARHDKGAGKKVKPISTATGRNIVRNRVKAILGEDAAGSITPHSFRHYFVTNILKASGGNLKLAQELARHKNIQVTQRYAHLVDDELDKSYHEIFNEL